MFICCEIEKEVHIFPFGLINKIDEELLNDKIMKNNKDIVKFLVEFDYQLHKQIFVEEYILKNNLKNLFKFIENNSVYKPTNMKTILRITYLKLNFKFSYYLFVKIFGLISIFLGKNNIELKNIYLKKYKIFLLNNIEILIDYYYYHKQKYIKKLQEIYWMLNNLKKKDYEVKVLLNKLKVKYKNISVIMI